MDNAALEEAVEEMQKCRAQEEHWRSPVGTWHLRAEATTNIALQHTSLSPDELADLVAQEVRVLETREY